MMENETKKIEETKTEVTEKSDKPLSIVDEARTIRDEIKAEKEGLKAEKEALQKVQTESLLGGSSGGRVEATPPKEETPKEYNDRIDKELSEGKHDE